METFNTTLKRELAGQATVNPSSALSQLSAIIKTCGEIQRSNEGQKIIIYTEILEIYDKINKILDSLYGLSAELEIADETTFSRYGKYQITIPSSISLKLLLDAEIMTYDEEKYLCFSQGISKYLTEEEENAKAYIVGAFLGAGTSNIVLSGDKNSAKNTGYHIEFVFNSDILAVDFSNLLAQFEILPKKVERKNMFVVYIKEFEQICNLLGIMGATKSYFLLQNENTVREVRNSVNRQNNCYSGNITKTINASVMQLNAIKTISESIGLESLDFSLQQACYLRLANPDESLENLAKLNSGEISKSGLYHRFLKILKIAGEL